MAIEIKAPSDYQRYTFDESKVLVFLAGSIDMGSARDWQRDIVEHFKDNKEVVFLNPRRNDWDSSWTQSIDNPQFFEQVTWEMDAMEDADLIAMVLTNESKAPISLLELGLHAADDKMLVCAEPEFWRRGNVEIVCDRYDIPLYSTVEQLIRGIEDQLSLL